MGWAHCCVMPPPTDSAAIDPRMLHRDDHINPPRPRGLDVPCARLRATNPLRALARCVQAGKPGTSSGHRSVPHTADLRIEAWAPTRDGCIRQAVLGTVESFLDLESAHAVHTRLRRLTADRDDDLLVAVLEEVIYLLDTVGETPVDLRLRDVDRGCRRHIRNDRCEYASSGGCRAEGGVTQRTSVLAGSPRLAMCGNARCVN